MRKNQTEDHQCISYIKIVYTTKTVSCMYTPPSEMNLPKQFLEQFLSFFSYFYRYYLTIPKSWALGLNLRLFSFCLLFFLFSIYIICISFLFYLLSFLLNRFIVLKDSISQVMPFKRTSFKSLWGQGILGTWFTTGRTELFFTGIFMLNEKQLLYKTDVQNFSKKGLFTRRMKRVFISVWLNLLVLLPKFSWSWFKGPHESENS